MKKLILLLACAISAPVWAGTTHTTFGKSPQEACDRANKAAHDRAKRIKTCVTTKCIPGTETVTVGGPLGFTGWAVSADHKGSC
jgi:hypothetical protein